MPMTEAQLNLSVIFMAKSRRTLEAAEVLLQRGYWSDAVNRLYYTTLYTIKALLLVRGIEIETHQAALRLLSLHYVKPRLMPSDTGRFFTDLLSVRLACDYNGLSEIDESDVESWRIRVIEFISRAETLLRLETNPPADN
jgi:uncharacterized protein (UPF0332 family)